MEPCGLGTTKLPIPSRLPGLAKVSGVPPGDCDSALPSHSRCASGNPSSWPFLEIPWTHLAFFYLASLLAGGFGQGLALIPGVDITFWPPVGILEAVLLANPVSTWPKWIVAGCLAELTGNALWFHNPLPWALVYFAGNALEALVAAWLIGRFLRRPFRLESIEEVGAFVAFGASLAPTVSATVIALTDVWVGKHSFTTTWPLVWLGDGTGVLVSTPLTLVAIQAWREREKIDRLRVNEAAVIGLILITVKVSAFKGYLPTAYMALPPLLWAAVRFQLRGAAVALGLTALITAAYTARGEGEFTGHAHQLHQKMVMLQTFLGIAAISALVAGALSQQWRQALTALQLANAELESRVAERTETLRASEESLRQSQAHLESLVQQRTARLNEMVSDLEAFSYSLVHDMRAPLRAMQSFAALLAEECGHGESADFYARRIRTAAERMDLLIRDGLHYACVMRAELPLKPVDVATLVCGIIQTYPTFEFPNAQIEIVRPIPLVNGNEATLTQCLSNLLGNAVKFVSPGVRPRVRVWGEAHGDRVRLFFQDNGIGIAADHQSKLFKIFERLNSTYEGTGIGLAIVKKAAERMGGTVGVESTPGVGSKFWLELARAESAPPDPIEAHPHQGQA